MIIVVRIELDIMDGIVVGVVVKIVVCTVVGMVVSIVVGKDKLRHSFVELFK